MLRKVQEISLKFFNRTFGDSTIHGFQYVVKKDLHIFERLNSCKDGISEALKQYWTFFRLLWLVVLILSSFFSYWVFLDQYTRFKEKPTVLTIELLTHGTLPKPGITICPTYPKKKYLDNFSYASIIDPEVKKQIDEETFNNFVLTVIGINMTNLHNFDKFVNYSGLYEFDMLNITRDAYPKLQQSSISDVSYYRKVITELGTCFTTSMMSEIQDIDTRPLSLLAVKPFCISDDPCYDLASFKDTSAENYRVYFHNPYDILIGDSKDYDLLKVADSSVEALEKEDENKVLQMSIHRTLRYEEIVSEKRVRDVPLQGRRCLFKDESNSHFFKNYTTNICKMTCRIKNALASCGCVPFFYKLDKKIKLCDIAGLSCLSKTNWTSTQNCKCFDMCENLLVVNLEGIASIDNFDTKVEFSIKLPRTVVKRSVLFDFIDLIVGLGGSLALFLGFSFLSAVEIIFFIMEYALELIFLILFQRK